MIILVSPKSKRFLRWKKGKRFFLFSGIGFVFVLIIGIIGILKYPQTQRLKTEITILTAKKDKLDTIAKTVKKIKENQTIVHKLLGLNRNKNQMINENDKEITN